MLPGNFEGRHGPNFANKLSRTYALHLEALDKHRGKGQQKVTVDTFTSIGGGQAIVGNVPGGGGISNTVGSKPDGKRITDTREPEMRSATPGEAGSPAKVTGDEER